MHKNPDCAAALTNHIYYQMRELDVLSPGNFTDRSQHFQPNPRREGLPKTVTEWRARKEERKEERRRQRALGIGITQSESEDDERTAFDITNSGKDDSPAGFSYTNFSPFFLEENSESFLAYFFFNQVNYEISCGTSLPQLYFANLLMKRKLSETGQEFRII